MVNLEYINLEYIKAKRKRKKITLHQMSIALGYKTASGYFNVESGSVKLLAEQVPTICMMLDMEYCDIFLKSDFRKSKIGRAADEKTNSRLCKVNPVASKEKRAREK